MRFSNRIELSNSDSFRVRFSFLLWPNALPPATSIDAIFYISAYSRLSMPAWMSITNKIDDNRSYYFVTSNLYFSDSIVYAISWSFVFIFFFKIVVNSITQFDIWRKSRYPYVIILKRVTRPSNANNQNKILHGPGAFILEYAHFFDSVE